MKSKYLFQIIVLLTLLLAPLGANQPVRASTRALQDQATLSLSVTPTSLDVGEMATVTVSLNQVPGEGYTSAELTCTYTPNVVEASNIVIGNLFGIDPVTAINGPHNGRLIVAIAGSEGRKAMSSGVLLAFNVRGLQAGQSSLDCQARVSKGDTTLVDIPSIGTRLTVLGNVPTSTTTAAMRITIDPGQTTAVRIGVINPNETIRYLLNAAAGQVLSIRLTAPPNEVAIGVNGPTGLALKPLDANITWSATIPTGGDHMITLMALTGSSSKSYTLEVSLTPPAATATPTATPTIGPTLCDKVQLIADVTIPDGTTFSPGATFTKTWRLKNVGSCTWTTSYQLVFFSGEQMDAVSSASFPREVAPGQVVDMSINMTAPSTPGSYRGYWMFKNVNGALFGIGAQANKPWWVDIRVSGATATPTFRPTPCDKAEFVADINVPPGSVMSPGVQFTKTWRLKNVGTCDWTLSYRMALLSGDQMGAPSSIQVPGNVEPGQTVDLSLNLTAPASPGSYRGYWIFQNSTGSPFGIGSLGNEPWFVDIVVTDGTVTPSGTQPSSILQLVKSASSQTYSAPDQTITYTFTITNTGTTVLRPAQFIITDNRLGAPFNCGPANAILAPGQNVACSRDYKTTQADMALANITNSATASGGGLASVPATAVVTNLLAPATPSPSITPGAPTATPSPGTAYDFAANVCAATWFSGAGQLPCPGIDGNTNGFVYKLDNPRLETGAIDTRPGLLTFPQNVQNGYIQGVYPPFHVQNGDRFRSTISCEAGAIDCYLAFRLDYQTGTDLIRTFWGPFLERYDGHYYSVDVDLSRLAGEDVKFILTVFSAGIATGDRALWVGPIISRANTGSTPTVETPSTTIPTSTANDWLTLTNPKYGFRFNYPAQGQIVAGSNDNLTRIDLPATTGTNLHEKYVEVVVMQNANPCESPLPLPQSTEVITINGISFLKQTGETRAAGNTFKWTAYSTSRDQACVSFDFVLHSIDPSIFTTPPAILYNEEAESAVFGQVVSTFSWFDITATVTPFVPTPTFTSTPLSATPGLQFGMLIGQVVASKQVNVSLFDATNHQLVLSVDANSDGTYLMNAPAGIPYTIVAKADGFLSRQGFAMTMTDRTTTIPRVSLPAGDLDGNNVIDPFDALTIGMNYNMTSPSVADLNNDGIINVLDLELLARNYRKTGPVDWQ